jgi:tetratricopeptide (TPR) repeat protein
VTRALATALLALVLAALAFGVHVDALDNEFVWDDPIFLKDQLPYFNSVASAFLPPRGIPQFAERYYRPLVIVTYQLDEWITRTFWPMREWDHARRRVYHTSPVVLHALATALLFALGVAFHRAAGARGTGVYGAAVGTALFAVHPIHVESVAWMAGRSDVLCAIFFFGSLIAYVAHRRSARRGAFLATGLLAAVLALGAMLSKEVGLGLLVMVPAIDLALAASGRPRRRDVMLGWAVLAAVAALYLAMRQVVLPLPDVHLPPPTAIPRFRAIFGSLGWYLAKSVWPPPQAAFVPEVPGISVAIAGAIATLLLGGLTAAAFRRGAGSGWGREGLCVILFFAALAPALAIALARIAETPLAERYLYVPTAGACLLFGFLVERLAGVRPAVRPVRARLVLATLGATAVVAAAAYGTVRRIPVWASNHAFWLDAVAKAPRSGLPHFHLGVSFQTRGDFERAEVEYRRALELYTDSEGRSKAYSNLATIAIRRGRFRQAITLLDRYVSTDSKALLTMVRHDQGVSFQFDPAVLGHFSRYLHSRQIRQLQRICRLRPGNGGDNLVSGQWCSVPQVVIHPIQGLGEVIVQADVTDHISGENTVERIEVVGVQNFHIMQVLRFAGFLGLTHRDGQIGAGTMIDRNGGIGPPLDDQGRNLDLAWV